MTGDKIVNLPASIHQRLLNLDPERRHDFTPVLRRYAFERWLYRLGRSEYANRFILKGAMLFAVWTSDQPRKTMDLDLLATEELSEAGLRRALFTIAYARVAPDGLTFDTNKMVVEAIRDEAEYHGLRAKFSAFLGNIKISQKIDIGIGDPVWPEPKPIRYPTLLDLPAPRVRAYRKETTIAEKLDGMLDLGIANSRMKDFYDIALLADKFSFKGEELQRAVRVSLRRSQPLSLPDIPIAFTDGFAQDRDKNIQWAAFLRRMGQSASPLSFRQVVGKIKDFLLPVINKLKAGEEFEAIWEAGGPWRPREKRHDG